MSDVVRQMRKTKNNSRVSVRIGKLKSRLIKAAKRTNQDESEIVRAAIGEFLDGKTPQEIIEAVVKAKSEGAA